MARVSMAAGVLAQKPYRLEKMERNIYSVEELCYLLVQSAMFVDAQVMDPLLVSWLEKECALPELADKLRPLLGKDRELSEFVSIILRYVGFVSAEKEKKTRQIVSSGQGSEVFSRRLKRAQYCAENGKPYQALEDYEAILRDLPDSQRDIRARALCAQGQIYADLFRFRSAADVYKRAYDLNGESDTYFKYLAAMRLELSDAEYLSFISEHPEAGNASLELERRIDACNSEFDESEAKHTIDSLHRYSEQGQDTSYEIVLHQAIQQIKDEYIRTKSPSI